MCTFKIFSRGIIKENPTLKLVLGMCPTLAVTTTAGNAIGMGLSVTLVLIGSNLVISFLRKFIPDKVRIPAYITIIAGFVSIIGLFLKAYLPALDRELGIFIPLITVNCIILARAELFASKNPVHHSVLDGLGMGLGFTFALLIIGSVREFLGNGSWFRMELTKNMFDPAIIMILPPGGFLAFGFIMAIMNRLTNFGISQKSCAECNLQCANAGCKEGEA